MGWYILRVCLRLIVVAAICAFFAGFAYLSIASPVMNVTDSEVLAGLFAGCAAAAAVALGYIAVMPPQSMREYTAAERAKSRQVLAATRRLRHQKRQGLITIQIDEDTSLRVIMPGIRDRIRGFLAFCRGRDTGCDVHYSIGPDDGHTKMDVNMTIWVRYFNGGALAQQFFDTNLRHATERELDTLLERLQTSVDPVGITSLWVTGAEGSIDPSAPARLLCHNSYRLV